MGTITSACCESQTTHHPQRQHGSPTPKLSPTKSSNLGKSRLYESTNISSLRDINHPSEDEKTIEQTFDEIMFKNQSTEEKRNMKFSDFTILGQLGEGNFGSVYLVQLTKQKDEGKAQNYAMKRIAKENLSNKKMQENTKLEKFILSNLEHPFITSLKFAFKDARYVYLVMECAIGGPVESFLFINKNLNPRKNQRIKKFAQLGDYGIKFIAGSVILAIEHLHKNQIMYRDLKPENVIIFEDGYVKLTDFGLAKVIVSEQQAKTEAGTVIYYAPEIALRLGYSKLVDFWTLGIFIYELATSETPFRQQEILTRSKFQSQVIEAEKNRNWKDFKLSQEIKDIIDKFLRFNPADRLGSKGFNEIKSHPFFNGLDWSKLEKKELVSPLLKIIQEVPFKILEAKGLKIKKTISVTYGQEQDEGAYDWNFDHNISKSK